jgi:drug/metabolite transporter (DMT)-like permease
MKARTRAELMLVAMCVVWGTTFPLIRGSLAGTDPWLYLLMRFALASAFCLLVFHRKIQLFDLASLKRGLLLGLVLFMGFLLQTLGMVETSAGRSGFLTALYIVMVPLFISLWKLKWPRGRTLLAALLSLVGVAFLSGLKGSDLAGFSNGDLLTILCAAFFAIQILLTDVLPNRENVWTLHFWQLLTVALLSLPGWLILGEPRWEPGLQLWTSVLFTGILGSVLALGVMLRYQRETRPERAALVYSFEPVFAALMAFLLLGEKLGLGELAGAGLILLALFMAEEQGEAVNPAAPE